MLSYWIWLSQRPNLNDRRKWMLLRHFSDAEDLYFADSAAIDAIGGIGAEEKASLLDKDLSEAEKILDQCAAESIQILTIGDKAYPHSLKQIADPPAVLYYKGSLPDFNGLPVIGMVGNRHPSVYGTQIARRMGYEIAACGGLVVSGLAMGIDAASMSGAVLAGQSTVGVLGCGADIIYPRCNKELYAEVEHCGCILTEFAPGTQPYGWNFPKRNRIISGLSCGVVVIEAPEKSGSLKTAALAGEQGRDVFVVPGNVDAPGFVGSNRLLRGGAIAVTGGWDVIGEYETRFPGKIRRAEHAENLPQEMEEKSDLKVAEKSIIPAKKSNRHKNLKKISIDNPVSAPYIDLNNILKGLTPDECAVVSAITEKETLIDDVIGAVNMSAGKVLAILTILELKGKVKRLPGRRVSITGKS